ncbi:conjugal transfer protein [Bartonella taylorii]|uniref:conjugal transfer protein n=1 Tax=Bartonella taylorii TaxID=33046 RepID=UPI001ABBB8DE|nr:conjugal transfer protein [Bartonella taylorii]
MKYANTLQTKISRKVSTVLAALTVFLTIQPTCAQEKMSKLDMLIVLQYELSIIIPIAGAVMLLFLLLIYAFRLITKATFLRWAFSIIIASAAFYLSRILFYII